jgi:peptide chain release factor 2
MDPDFWSDSERAERIMRSVKANKKAVSKYKHIKEQVDEVEVLNEFFRAGEISEEELDIKYEEVLAFVEDIEFRNTMEST